MSLVGGRRDGNPHKDRENLQTPHRKVLAQNQGPSFCEATVLFTAQPCSPKAEHHFLNTKLK